MGKIKLIVKLLIVTLLIGFGFMAKPAYAATVSIQKLPSVINTNDFKLSCTVLGGTTAQFSVNKHGAGFVDFGPAINLATDSCQVQVTSSQVNDHTDYVFKVTVGSDSDQTSTTYDTSGPSPVSGYYKENLGDGFNKLHWRNPGDTDFSQVVIYRGDTPDFSADSSHEVARIAGSPNSDMTYDDHYSPDGKTHYYNIRALDQAGNSSSLVGDGGTTTTTTTSTPTPAAGGGTVRILPQEQAAQGQVLSEEASPTPAATASPFQRAKASLFGTTKGGVIVGLIIIVGIAAYFIFRKRD